MNNIQNEINKLLTIQQVAKRLHKGVRTIERWVHDGKLPAIHIKHNILVDVLDLPTYLRVKKEKK
jgi:excisionase family DNA binding protein